MTTTLDLPAARPRLSLRQRRPMWSPSHGETRPLWRALALASLVVSAALVGCGKVEPPPFKRPPAPVEAVRAKTADVPVYLDVIGTCAPHESVTIQPKVSGTIIGIQFADGADLNPKDPLFTIDPRPYQAALDSANAALARSKAVHALTLIDFSRYDKLTDFTVVTKQDYDSKKSAIDVAAADIQAAQAAVDTAALNLEYCTIRSPMVGRAGHRLVDVNNYVKTDTPLLVIQQITPIDAEFSVAENDLTRVQEQMAKGKLSVEIRLPDQADSPIAGDVTFLDNAVQPATGTVRMRALVPNLDHRLWPGRFVQVRLVLATLQDAVLVPTSATQVSAKGPYVYVVGDEDKAELRPVTVGQRQGEFVVISSGLDEGEVVVTNGHLGVIPGGVVAIKDLPAPDHPRGGNGDRVSGRSSNQSNQSNPGSGTNSGRGNGSANSNANSASNSNGRRPK